MSSCTIDVCSITVSPSSWQGIPGESFVAYATVYPSDATDQRITWVTDKASIATVTADGLVVAQGRGTTRISAVARDGSMVYGSCTVTVTPKINVTSVGLSIHALTLNPNSCCVLKAEVCPANASSRKLIWSSSDNNVATVTDGKVWALRAGTATITAMANDGTGQKDTCRITVKRDTVLVSSVSVCPSSRHVARGESFLVSAAVSPEGAEDRSVRWSSSNTNIATVNSSGLVYAQGIGTACITAVANDESGYSDSCFVKVSTTIPVSSMVLDIHQRTLNPDTFVVVSAIVCPENASDRSICWTSSNTRVATVEKGKVRAVGMGMAMQGSGISGMDVGSATLKVNDDGFYSLIIGAADMGTGCDTTLAQIAAEVLDCDLDNITVFGADTDTSPYDSGSYASSTTYVTGKAVEKCALRLRGQICKLGAELLQTTEDAVDFDGKFVSLNADPEKRVSLSEVAFASQFGHMVPLEITETHTSPLSPPPYMVGAAEIELDKETGEVKVVDYAACVDCGTPINPNLTRVQAEGGILQGIGMALTENITYDAKGWPMENSFMQYKIPARVDIGHIRVEFESSYEPNGPFGAKSIGEVVINTPLPAIADAIYNAIGTRFYELPITPEQVAMAVEENR